MKPNTVLTRKDSIKLAKAMKEAEKNPVSKAEYERMVALFNRVIKKNPA
jgi:hypothetical protein